MYFIIFLIFDVYLSSRVEMFVICFYLFFRNSDTCVFNERNCYIYIYTFDFE